MTLRAMEQADADLTLAWRNREAVRKSMFQTDVLAPETHAAWIARTIEDPARAYFIFETDGAPQGVVGFTFRDLQTRIAEWSFHIGTATPAPRAGTQMLTEALAQFFTDLDGNVLYGEVIEDNTPSRHLHTKLGFQHQGLRDEGLVHEGREKAVHLYRMDRALWTSISPLHGAGPALITPNERA